MENERETKSFAGSYDYFAVLRFLATIMIAVLLHYQDHFLPSLGLAESNPFMGNKVLWFWSRHAGYFVEMFFMISGILFFCAYMKKIIHKEYSFDDFMKRRIIRLYPLMILTTLVTYIGQLIVYYLTDATWSACGTIDLWDLFSDILFAGKVFFNAAPTLNGPVWYLNILMVCYIFAYLLTKLYVCCHSMTVYLIPIILGIMMRYSGVGFPGWNSPVSRGYISFFIGIFVGLFLEKSRDFKIKTKKCLCLCMAAELVLAFVIRISPFSDVMVKNDAYYFPFMIFPELLILLYYCKWINQLGRSRIVKWLGNISFGMYLWNFPIYLGLYILQITIFAEVSVVSKKYLLIIGIIHMIVAVISYYIVDNKLVGYLKKLCLTEKAV